MPLIYNLLDLMLNVLELVRDVVILTNNVLQLADLVQVKVYKLVTFLEPEGVIFQLFRVIFEGIHDYLANFRFKLKPLSCLRLHCKR